MKGILLLAVGSLGAGFAGSLIAAGPVSADVGCSPDFVCDVVEDQPNTFQTSIQDSFGSFTSIITGQAAAQQAQDFVTGSCADFEAPPVTDETCGIVNQPGHFASDLASQPQTFVDSINPVTNLQTFGGSILGGPQTFVDSITKPFGPDDGPDFDD
jgi:hypothetical protein